jgi:hypothetical protein
MIPQKMRISDKSGKDGANTYSLKSFVPNQQKTDYLDGFEIYFTMLSEGGIIERGQSPGSLFRGSCFASVQYHWAYCSTGCMFQTMVARNTF